MYYSIDGQFHGKNIIENMAMTPFEKLEANREAQDKAAGRGTEETKIIKSSFKKNKNELILRLLGLGDKINELQNKTAESIVEDAKGNTPIPENQETWGDYIELLKTRINTCISNQISKKRDCRICPSGNPDSKCDLDTPEWYRLLTPSNKVLVNNYLKDSKQSIQQHKQQPIQQQPIQQQPIQQQPIQHQPINTDQNQISDQELHNILIKSITEYKQLKNTLIKNIADYKKSRRLLIQNYQEYKRRQL